MSEIKILPLLYDLILWYVQKINLYPKKFKYSLGERIVSCFLDLLERVIEARYASGKKSHFLRQANLQLEKLRYLVRLSKDLQCITIKDYEYVIRQTTEIGRMIGGWEKYSKDME